MQGCEQRQTAARYLSIERGAAQSPREAQYCSNDPGFAALTIVSACHFIRIAYYYGAVN